MNGDAERQRENAAGLQLYFAIKSGCREQNPPRPRRLERNILGLLGGEDVNFLNKNECALSFTLWCKVCMKDAS
jgi:hypothetical protein